ncbi:CpsD/CapB family tyrosine-protein kinase [Cohnella nanjingensis]|uniref:non-specific protein-tyrosine kinase n=1 Tax=Cohnella nanjingensis TaxID=1387779 RepID=A0A7X0RW74_9BACL|nr:CpsD/CapB family tyrosine-protein kinase [Cohnella nanjingensis]MBB6674807.1 CpsD/CapB family tyrosine-protein kinase [Cohnella nanjingensis]
MSRLTESRKRIITDRQPKSPVAEAYRTLRTNLQYSGLDEPIRTLMVTSAAPQEGKSTTINNLAVAYAQGDCRVLLLDADMRKPTAHFAFGLSNRFGLSSVLAGQSELLEAVQSTHVHNLSVLTSGATPPNPAEMLASRKMDKLLADLRERYDLILIDTPPVLAVSDAQIVSTKCEGVLLVVKAGELKRGPALRAKEQLSFVGARMLGVVLNQAKGKDAGHYYNYNA